jgi:hypothetical protein
MALRFSSQQLLPGLAYNNSSTLYAAWTSGSDILWAIYPDRDNEWGLVHVIADTDFADKPSLAWMPSGDSGILVMAWRLTVLNDEMYFSTLKPSLGIWTTPSGLDKDIIPGVSSSTGPSLTYVASPQFPQIYSTWKGVGGDQNIYLEPL